MNMKNVKATTKEVFEVYKLLESAKLPKLDSADVLAIVKNTKSLKKIIDEFASIRDEVVEKMKDSEFYKMQKERVEILGTKEKSDELIEQVESINAYFQNFNSKVASALNPDFIKENEIEMITISADSLAKLAANNDLSIADLMKLSELFVE